MSRMQISGAGRSQHVAVSLLREGPWASLPTETVELLAAGGSLSDVLAGVTVYTEADAERFCVIVRGLLRVYTARERRPPGNGPLRSCRRPAGCARTRRRSRAGVRAGVDRQRRVLHGRGAGEASRPARRGRGVGLRRGVGSPFVTDILEELAGNTFATVRQRVVRHLLDLAASRPATGGRLAALVSQQDLANSVGSVREVVARVLRELRAASLVRTSPGRVEILDPLKMSLELWSRAT